MPRQKNASSSPEDLKKASMSRKRIPPSTHTHTHTHTQNPTKPPDSGELGGFVRPLHGILEATTGGVPLTCECFSPPSLLLTGEGKKRQALLESLSLCRAEIRGHSSLFPLV